MHLAQVISSELCNDLVYNLCCLYFWATFIAGGPLDSVLLLILIPCLASGVSIPCWYEILAGAAVRSRHEFTPDTALSSDLSINSWASMDSHVLPYFCFQGKHIKMSALKTPLLFLHEYFMFLELNCQEQGSSYITRENDGCCSQKSTMPGKCKPRNFASVLFAQFCWVWTLHFLKQI